MVLRQRGQGKGAQAQTIPFQEQEAVPQSHLRMLSVRLHDQSSIVYLRCCNQSSLTFAFFRLVFATTLLLPALFFPVWCLQPFYSYQYNFFLSGVYNHSTLTSAFFPLGVRNHSALPSFFSFCLVFLTILLLRLQTLLPLFSPVSNNQRVTPF